MKLYHLSSKNTMETIRTELSCDWEVVSLLLDQNLPPNNLSQRRRAYKPGSDYGGLTAKSEPRPPAGANIRLLPQSFIDVHLHRQTAEAEHEQGSGVQPSKEVKGMFGCTAVSASLKHVLSHQQQKQQRCSRDEGCE